MYSKMIEMEANKEGTFKDVTKYQKNLLTLEQVPSVKAKSSRATSLEKK